MSTRCNVVVKDEHGQELWFYRHGDGYPESVLPSLQPLIDKVNDGTLRGNLVQFSGWIIKQGIDEYKELLEKHPEMYGWKVGATSPQPNNTGTLSTCIPLNLGRNPTQSKHSNTQTRTRPLVTGPLMTEIIKIESIPMQPFEREMAPDRLGVTDIYHDDLSDEEDVVKLPVKTTGLRMCKSDKPEYSMAAICRSSKMLGMSEEVHGFKLPQGMEKPTTLNTRPVNGW